MNIVRDLNQLQYLSDRLGDGDWDYPNADTMRDIINDHETEFLHRYHGTLTHDELAGAQRDLDDWRSDLADIEELVPDHQTGDRYFDTWVYNQLDWYLTGRYSPTAGWLADGMTILVTTGGPHIEVVHATHGTWWVNGYWSGEQFKYPVFDLRDLTNLANSLLESIPA